MKKALLAGIFISLLIGLHFFLKNTPFSFSIVRERVLSYGSLGPLLIIGLYVLSSIVLFPATFFTLLAGALYGPWLAVLYVTVGANLGATFAFFLSRFFGFEFAKKILQKYFPRVEKQIQRKGFSWVFGLRLLPITPFVFFNYAAGLTPVRWRDYALGSLLGMFPMTFIYSTLGATLGEFSEQGAIDWVNPWNWAPFALAIAVYFTIKRLH